MRNRLGVRRDERVCALQSPELWGWLLYDAGEMGGLMPWSVFPKCADTIPTSNRATMLSLSCLLHRSCVCRARRSFPTCHAWPDAAGGVALPRRSAIRSVLMAMSLVGSQVADCSSAEAVERTVYTACPPSTCVGRHVTTEQPHLMALDAMLRILPELSHWEDFGPTAPASLNKRCYLCQACGARKTAKIWQQSCSPPPKSQRSYLSTPSG